MAAIQRGCAVKGCDEKHAARGLCRSHYYAHRRGKPVAAMRPIERDPVARFMAKVMILPSGHWMWTGATASEGRYGSSAYRGTTRPAHVVAWILFRGEDPSGLDVDHLCRTTLCVNPEHLQPKSHQANVLAGDSITARQARQTHCKRGHLFDEINTRITSTGGRYCRACDRARYAEKRAQK